MSRSRWNRRGLPVTPAQAKVLAALCAPDEPTQARVAARLGLAHDTVKHHVEGAAARLGTSTLLGTYRRLTALWGDPTVWYDRAMEARRVTRPGQEEHR